MPNLMFTLGFVYEIVQLVPWHENPTILASQTTYNGKRTTTIRNCRRHLHLLGFIKNRVKVGKAAKSITKATASNLSFDQWCKHCEKGMSYIHLCCCSQFFFIDG